MVEGDVKASQTRTVRVFCSQRQRRSLGRRYDLLEKYQNFALFRVSPADLPELTREFAVDDLTARYRLPVGPQGLDTDVPRVMPSGRFRPHPAYEDVPRLSGGKHHFLIQFIGPVKSTWLRGVQRLGGELRRPTGHFCWIVRTDRSHLKQIRNRPYVRWAGHFSHRDRIRVAYQQTALPRSRFLPHTYVLEFFDHKDLYGAAETLGRQGCDITVTNGASGIAIADLCGLDDSHRALVLDGLSSIHGVAAIRRRSIKRTSNDVASEIIGLGEELGEEFGLTGSSEVIAVCDTGLDSGDANDIHPDFEGRVVGITSYPVTSDFSPWISNAGGDDGAADLDSGHGTHVAGSALGSGARSEELSQQTPIRGAAPGAFLFFQAVEQYMDWNNPQLFDDLGAYLLSGIPDDIRILFSDAYEKGARIHSNSWGGGEPGEYDAQARQLDQFVREHPDFCVIVAAGNDGTDFDGDGNINPMSVTSPATAKNCITVGASESLRPRFNGQRYGDWWPDDYPVAPYRNAPMANSPRQIAAFSSRGPTQDGRTKPDVVAPGTFILSTRSRRIAPNNFAWGAFTPSKSYFFMGGTSMATPLVAGSVALLRQYLKDWVGYSSPTAALVKACLAIGAQKLQGVSARSVVSDQAQGFGRVNLATVIDPQPPRQVYFVEDEQGLDTGETELFPVSITDRNTPFKVAMAYSDYPGESLINNVNLLLESPSGRRFAGNGDSKEPLEFDGTNNLEIVLIEKPEVGDWKVIVVGADISVGPQPYAMVLLGAIAET